MAGSGTKWPMVAAGAALAALGLGLAARLAPGPLAGLAGPAGSAAALFFAGAGVALLAAGFMGRRSSPTPAVTSSSALPAASEPVEIKDTPMEWAAREPSRPDPLAEARREDLRLRIAQLKVRYGLGQVEPGAFRRLMNDLEKEQARLERAHH